MREKVLIIGPIGDFGGREIEVNIIAKSIETNYDIKIVSTGYMTASSFALQKLNNISWSSLNKELFDTFYPIKFFSLLSKFINKGKLNANAYANNSLTKKFYPIDKLYFNLLKKELNKADQVILCVQLTSKFLKEIVEYCHEKAIPCFVRTTGTIHKIDVSKFQFLKKVTRFIHHSESNAINLNRQINLPYVIIDQCALNEEQLLKIVFKLNTQLTFGYLGRLTTEKGIVPVVEFFSKTEYKFIVAGDGNKKEEIQNLIKNSKNCNFIGILNNKELVAFFEKIDVLIIPSFEESGPLVGLEAMAAGKLIISTKVGSMMARLKNMKSFWFEIENVHSIINSINEIEHLNSEELNNISKNYRQKYIEEYSLDVISQKYLNILEIK